MLAKILKRQIARKLLIVCISVRLREDSSLQDYDIAFTTTKGFLYFYGNFIRNIAFAFINPLNTELNPICQ